MESLFDVLDAIIKTGREEDVLSFRADVRKFANSCGLEISSGMAHSIIMVRKEWLHKMEHIGEGGEEKARQEAKYDLACYKHIARGHIASAHEWFYAEYLNTCFDVWFGVSLKDAKGRELNWLYDSPYLVKVERVNGKWVEVQK